MPEAPGGPRGTVASSFRHGWLRRNAVSPHGVRLSGAPGAPLWVGCSSANRALAGKLLWDGIVAVPEVFGAGCFALSPGRKGAGDPAVRALSDSISLDCGHTATHGGTQRVAAIVDSWRQLTCSVNHNSGPTGSLYRVDGPSGVPRRPRNHGRTISERHNRNPQRRANRV